MIIESEIRIFTLNCWGIPVISSDRTQRIKAIAHVLCVGKYDLVCLQEVWDTQDFFFLKKHLIQVLPHSQYFYSGVLGSGLCLFSKYPFQDVFFHQWSLNGYVHKIQHGDWFGGKGIGMCSLRIKNMVVNLYTAHLHAEYDRNNDEYLSHRVLQAFDTAQFVRITSSNCDLVILGGDLNTEPSDLSYRILCSEAQLEDTFLHSGTIPDDCIGTNESDRNSYSDENKLVYKKQGKRIDYILFRTGPTVYIKNIKYELPLPSRVPGYPFSYSDHEAVSATVIINKNTEAVVSSNYDVDASLHKEALCEGLVVCEEALQKLARDKYFYWILSCTLFLVLLSICTTNPPYEMHGTYKIILAVISVLMCFTGFMSFLWNRMEVNGIMAGKLAMELAVAKCYACETELGSTNRTEEQIREG